MTEKKSLDPRPIFDYALQNCPQLLQVMNVTDLLHGTARSTRYAPARIELAVSDDLVKNQRGAAERRDLLLLIRIPRQVIERAGRRIILPGELTGRPDRGLRKESSAFAHFVVDKAPGT